MILGTSHAGGTLRTFQKLSTPDQCSVCTQDTLGTPPGQAEAPGCRAGRGAARQPASGLTPGHKDTESSTQVTSCGAGFWRGQSVSQRLVCPPVWLPLSLVRPPEGLKR